MRSSILLGAAGVILFLSGCNDMNTGPNRLQCEAVTSQRVDMRGDTVVTATGLQYIELRSGGGATAASCRRLLVKYRGELLDGTVFDPGTAPLDFILGYHPMVRGFEEGIVGMQVGEQRRLIIPPTLGYGDQPRPGIPAGSTLIFDVELQQVAIFQ
jgi:peptidylprolyl isomerase